MATALLRWFKFQEIKWKFIAFMALFVYVVIVFAVALSRFRTDDPVPDVAMLTMDMRKQFQEFSAEIRTGLFVKNFPTLSFYTNDFTLDALIWFEFDADKVPLETISKFTFENGKILKKSAPKIEKIGSKILVKYDIIASFKSDLNYYRFPFSDHRVSMVLTNQYVTANELYFGDSIDSLSLVVSEDVFISNWKIHALQRLGGFSFISFDEHTKDRQEVLPYAVFTVNFEKTGFKDIMIIFMPLLAAVFLALFSFLMSFNNDVGKLTVTLAAFNALLSYRFVIQKMMPEVGYFTVTDYLYLFFLVLTFLIFVFQLVISRNYLVYTLYGKTKSDDLCSVDRVALVPRQSEMLNSWVYFICIISFVIFITYFTFV